jgi:hypothetical protein
MITVLLDIAAQQVEKVNDTKTIRVSLIGFDSRAQDTMGIEPIISVIYFEFQMRQKEIQQNATRNILINASFVGYPSLLNTASEAECKIHLHLNRPTRNLFLFFIFKFSLINVYKIMLTQMYH